MARELRDIFTRERGDDHLSREVRAHLDEEADEQIEHGVAPEPVGPEAFVPVSRTRYRARRAKSGSASPSAPAAPTCSA